MMLYNSLSMVLVYLCVLFSLSSSKPAKAGAGAGTKRTSPNIIFILMDDVGWNDVSFNGGQFPTPNIDWLQSNGVSMQRHYIHLMCSPSRSQFITGRYAMYSGYGQMLPWDYTEIGGIPIGQPTVASWLQQMGDYKTYAVGKWHLGYSSEQLLPTARGFDHFYGFYQGAIHYDNLKYIDIKYGDSNHFDFWEDSLPMTTLADNIADRHEAISEYTKSVEKGEQLIHAEYADASIYDDNTMYLYRNKIIQYIDEHQAAAAAVEAENTNDEDTTQQQPFYMYLALQTIHGPLNEVPAKLAQCAEILPDDATNRRQKYCQNMLLTDEVIGDIIQRLQQDQELWDNTLIVFTSDNGGDIANKGCNYPLRGTKGTLFDGNLRTMALVSGGVLPQEQRGTTRDVLFSSLDWTPTLLKFANLLNKISKNEFTWDGINQYDVIMYGQDHTGENYTPRDHIVMNIGTHTLESASIVFEYDDVMYKYIAKRDDIDRWAYIRDDGWCVPDEDGNFALIMDEDLKMASDVDNKYLFDLTNDIAEKTNLLQVQDYSELVDYAKSILTTYTEHRLYSEPLKFLWNRLPAGNPAALGDGAFVAPFLDEEEYTWHLKKGFHSIDALYKVEADEKGIDVHDLTPYSKALQGMFFKAWEAPNKKSLKADTQTDEEQEEQVAVVHSSNNNSWIKQVLAGNKTWIIIVFVAIVAGLISAAMCARYFWAKSCKKDRSTNAVSTETDRLLPSV